MLIRIYNSQYPPIHPSIFLHSTFRALETNTNKRNIVNEKAVRFQNGNFRFIFLILLSHALVLNSSRLVFSLLCISSHTWEKIPPLGGGGVSETCGTQGKRIMQISLYGHVSLKIGIKI